MPKRLLDTSVLITHWHRRRPERLQDAAIADAASWGEELVQLHQTRSIATPIFIEFVAGTQSAHELQLVRSYLNCFECVDARRISEADWEKAQAMAQRIPRNGNLRQLGDCLIRAIATRLHYEVFSLDAGLRSLRFYPPRNPQERT